MRKVITVAVTLGLIVGSLAMPAEAKKKKKKPPAPVPVATSMFMHGTEQVGELDTVNYQANGVWMTMDGVEPTGAEAKSVTVTNYGAGPNSNCNANGLVPTWVGPLTGHVVGDVKVTLFTSGMPGKLRLVLTPDVAESQCNDARVEPVGDIIIDAPGGMVEAVFEGVDFSAMGNLALQVSNGNYSGLPDVLPPLPPPAPGTCLSCRTIPYQVRLNYDAADVAAKIEFGCFPTTGTSCLPAS